MASFKHGFPLSKLPIVIVHFDHILQALYFCVPFREQLLEHYANNKIPGDAEENLLTCLAELFSQVVNLVGYKMLSFGSTDLFL